MAYAFEDDKSKVDVYSKEEACSKDDVAGLIKTKTVSNYNSPQISSNVSQPALFRAGIDLSKNQIIGISIIVGNSFPFAGYWYDTEDNEIVLALIYAGSSGTIPIGQIQIEFSYIEIA